MGNVPFGNIQLGIVPFGNGFWRHVRKAIVVFGWNKLFGEMSICLFTTVF